MEQQIRFCTTSDGVRIAYATVGKGPPLVRALGWFTHLEYEWKSPLWRHIIEGLAEKHQLIRYDGRGTGLSDRDIEEQSLDAWVRDLEAVVDALQLPRFAILGISQGGAIAVRYARCHPDRVNQLVFYGSYGRWPRPMDTEQDREVFQSVLTLTRVGWGQNNPAFRQMFTTLFIPDANAEQMHSFDELQRNSSSPENAVKLMQALTEVDVTDMLPQINVPTLVLHRRGDQAVPFEAGRELASLIPSARFVPLEGNNHVFMLEEEESQTFFQEVEEFLGEGEAQATAYAVRAALVTIMFTDMEGSTTLTQRLGDARAQEVLRTHNAVVRDALKACEGSQIKHTGDGVMATFAAASKALECAVTIQQAFADRNESAETPIRVRIGLNAGEPVAEDEDLFGTAVQLAARICAHAQPGQILASNVVRELAAGKGVMFSDQGEVTLRGFEEPVRLYEVRWG
jgi:class 3 adenylate cyclase/pimeloyl-ACP methyl ester carboxylesterase